MNKGRPVILDIESFGSPSAYDIQVLAYRDAITNPAVIIVPKDDLNYIRALGGAPSPIFMENDERRWAPFFWENAGQDFEKLEKQSLHTYLYLGSLPDFDIPMWEASEQPEASKAKARRKKGKMTFADRQAESATARRDMIDNALALRKRKKKRK